MVSFDRRSFLRSLPLFGAVAGAGCNELRGGGEAEPPSPESPQPTEIEVTTGTETADPDGGTPTVASDTRTGRATATVSEPTTTASGGGGITVTDLGVEQSTVRQGDRVAVTVTLSNGGGEEVVHPLRVRADDEVLRRKRIAVGPGDTATATVEIRSDSAGRRQFSVGERRASVDVEQRPSSFVGVEGTEFVVDGDPFPVFGTNNAYLSHKSAKTVDEVFRDAAAMGLNTVRVMLNGGGREVGYCREFACGRPQFGLQPGPREYDEASFRRLDYVIAAAKRHGIRLVVSLITLSPGGVAAYLDWVDGATARDDFFTHEETRTIYREYLEAVLTRENTYTGVEYREDPTVCLWELINEPELQEGAVYGGPLQEWIAEMANHAKSLDPNHLVSVGMIGWNSGDNESDYLACFEPDAVDAASTHMYYDSDGIDDWVRRHATGVHEDLGKPLYVGEFGWDATRTEPDYDRQLRNRNRGFEEWTDQFVANDVAGSLFWFLLGHLDDGARFPDHDGFGVYYPEDAGTVDILESHAERVGAAEWVGAADSVGGDDGSGRG